MPGKRKKVILTAVVIVVAVAAFIAHLNPTLEEMADVKTAVSEAVTNSIIHGYENLKGYGRAERDWEEVHKGKVRVRCILEKEILPLKEQGVIWGYDIPYLLTGQLNQHPRTAIAATREKRTDYRKFYVDLVDYK